MVSDKLSSTRFSPWPEVHLHGDSKGKFLKSGRKRGLVSHYGGLSSGVSHYRSKPLNPVTGERLLNNDC